MFRKSNNLVVGLTTFHHEFLKLSVSGLSGFNKKITLIIHNDNPCKRLKKRAIRKLGYRGRLHIINSNENIGLIKSRVSILDFIKQNKISGQWFMFANDDDVVLGANTPNLSDNIFAIMGNAVVVKSKLLDVFRVMESRCNYTIDGTDVILNAPHVGMAGTIVRMQYVLSYGEFLSSVMPSICECISDAPFKMPVDTIMWNGFVEFMRATQPEMTPIYMNQTNYLMTKLNSTRYATDNQNTKLVARALAVVAAALRGNE